MAAKIRATHPDLKALIKAEAFQLLTYMESLARLTALELGLEMGDGTTPADVEIARAEHEQVHGGSDLH